MILAQPGWVNLLILVPVAGFWLWRKRKIDLSWPTLTAAAIFGLAFGVVEAVVVIYLRGISAVINGYGASLAEIARFSKDIYQLKIVNQIHPSLLSLEFFREIATMIMLAAVAFIATPKWRERWAVFLWTFAVWDIFYYAVLYLTLGWPMSLTTTDILFLVPVVWLGPVWFPLSVSILTLLAVGFNLRQPK